MYVLLNYNNLNMKPLIKEIRYYFFILITQQISGKTPLDYNKTLFTYGKQSTVYLNASDWLRFDFG